jgi:hypothetical protein
MFAPLGGRVGQFDPSVLRRRLLNMPRADCQNAIISSNRRQRITIEPTPICFLEPTTG